METNTQKHGGTSQGDLDPALENKSHGERTATSGGIVQSQAKGQILLNRSEKSQADPRALGKLD